MKKIIGAAGTKPRLSKQPRIFVSGLLIVLHVVLLSPLTLELRGTAAQVLLLLPGICFGLLLTRAGEDVLERSFAAVCCGFVVELPLLLALHALPGGLSWWRVLVPFDLLTLAMGWQLIWSDGGRRTVDGTPNHRPPSTVRRLVSWPWLAVVAVLALGLAFRLPFLGGAEFQGDEANAMLMAVEAVNGRGEILLWHTKGPAEVLLPFGTLALVGSTNEWLARLPFMLAGETVLLGVIVLGRRLILDGGRRTVDGKELDRLPPTVHHEDGRLLTGTAIGLLAACILALDGYLIAFSRIVQYQSVVALMSIGAVWCCWRFFAGAPRPFWLLGLAAALLAVGLLAHYDAIFVLPVMASLVIAGGWKRGWRVGQWLFGFGVPLLVGAVLLASFFVPFVLHERFQRTLTYLGSRVGQDDGGFRLFNKLSEYYLRTTFYNTTFQITTYALVLLGAVVVWLHLYVRPRPLGWLVAAFLLVCCVPLARDSGSLDLANGNSWAVVVVAVPLAVLLLAPATPAALRTLLLWFAPPFLAETFLFVQPKTHFYTMHLSGALLLGFALVQFAGWLGSRWRNMPRLVLAAVGVTLVALAVPYQYILFVRQWPEYRLVYPAARPAIYRAYYGDELRWVQGFFGFAHTSGWKAIGALYESGKLHGNFASNEDFLITHWYTRKAANCSYNPDYFLYANNPVEAKSKLADHIRATYALWGRVLVDGREQITIYSRLPVQSPPQVFDLDQLRGAFDTTALERPIERQTTMELVPTQQSTTAWPDGLTLRDVDLGTRTLYAGQDTALTLQWHAPNPLPLDYQVVAIITDDAGHTTPIGTACQKLAPTAWHTQNTVETTFGWVADPQLVPGTYRVQIQLLDPQTNKPLLVANGTSALTIATLKVAAQ